MSIELNTSFSKGLAHITTRNAHAHDFASRRPWYDVYVRTYHLQTDTQSSACVHAYTYTWTSTYACVHVYTIARVTFRPESKSDLG